MEYFAWSYFLIVLFVFALIFNLPFKSDVSIEVYGGSLSDKLLSIQNVIKFLRDRGVSYIYIKIFNLRRTNLAPLFQKNGKGFLRGCS